MQEVRPNKSVLTVYKYVSKQSQYNVVRLSSERERKYRNIVIAEKCKQKRQPAWCVVDPILAILAASVLIMSVVFRSAHTEGDIARGGAS